MKPLARGYNRPTILNRITKRISLPVPSQGKTEAAVRNAIIKFEQEFLGRGPDEVRAFIVRDMLVVRLKGVAELIGTKITALCTDIDTHVRERIFVFTLESDLEGNYR